MINHDIFDNYPLLKFGLLSFCWKEKDNQNKGNGENELIEKEKKR